jgi:diamine N-acetyltransferase
MTEEAYFSYLLRCWQSGQGQGRIWRVSLEDPHTGERIGFAGFDDVVKFLKSRLSLRREYLSKEDCMAVTLRPITCDNWIQCIELAPTAEQQQNSFVAPNQLSLAQAYAEPWWQPYAIYAGEQMVGFVLYGCWPERGVPDYHTYAKPGVHCVLRFMIDGRYQGRGHGRAAMERVVEQICHEPGAHTIELSVDPNNEAAQRLYNSLGFQRTGNMVEDEIEMRLVLNAP